MEDIQFRTALEEDLSLLYGFEQGIISAERPFDSTLKPDPISYYDLRALILSESAELIVAYKGNELLASGYAKIRAGETYHKHDYFAYLGFMYVKPAYRGQGIISALTEQLKSWIRKQNISELRLEVYNDNIPAIKAYEKSGFKKHLIEMRMSLD